jgi:hypothetical protein
MEKDLPPDYKSTYTNELEEKKATRRFAFFNYKKEKEEGKKGNLKEILLGSVPDIADILVDAEKIVDFMKNFISSKNEKTHVTKTNTHVSFSGSWDDLNEEWIYEKLRGNTLVRNEVIRICKTEDVDFSMDMRYFNLTGGWTFTVKF